MGRPGFCSFTKPPGLCTQVHETASTPIWKIMAVHYGVAECTVTQISYTFSRPIGSSNKFVHALRLEGE
jgi:hypothetical protein